MLRLLALTAACALAGCAAPLASLKVHGDRFTPGESIHAQLQNGSSFYDLEHGGLGCFTSLEVQAGGTWVEAPGPDRICTLLAYVTFPSSTIDYRFKLFDALVPGRYRLKLSVTRGAFRLFGLPIGGYGENATVRSNDFSVSLKGAPR